MEIVKSLMVATLVFLGIEVQATQIKSVPEWSKNETEWIFHIDGSSLIGINQQDVTRDLREWGERHFADVIIAERDVFLSSATMVGDAADGKLIVSFQSPFVRGEDFVYVDMPGALPNAVQCEFMTDLSVLRNTNSLDMMPPNTSSHCKLLVVGYRKSGFSSNFKKASRERGRSLRGQLNSSDDE